MYRRFPPRRQHYWRHTYSLEPLQVSQHIGIKLFLSIQLHNFIEFDEAKFKFGGEGECRSTEHGDG